MFAPSGSSYGNASSYPLLSVDKSGALLSPYAPSQDLASPLLPCEQTSASVTVQTGLDHLDLNASSNAGTPCPILPASFSMWTQNASGSTKHVYANLTKDVMDPFARNQQTLPQKSLESVRESATRFPQLAHMHRRMPCQFLHAHVPLSLPRNEDALPADDEFGTQLLLTSAQDLQLAAVTSLYLQGKRVSCVVEPVTCLQKLSHVHGTVPALRKMVVDERPSTPTSDADPRRVSNGSSLSFSPVSNSSHGLGSPRTPPEVHNTASTSTSSLQHQWSYQAPLKTAFLAEFMRRERVSEGASPVQDTPSFAKSQAQRALLGTAMSSLTIVQEFVIPAQQVRGSQTLSHEAEHLPSLGSTVGDVVLVIAWDFECDEALVNQPGSPVISLLTAANGVSPMRHTTPLPSPLLKFDDKPSENAFAFAQSTSQAPTLLRKRGMSLNKANLMLNIPSASTYLNAQGAPNSALLGGGQPQLTPLHSPTPMAWGSMHQRAMRTPLTPLPQQGEHTLHQPPPLNSGDEARLQKERLERLWASKADGMVGPLHSPLEMTFGANATCMPPAASTSMAAAAKGGFSPNPSGLTVPTSSGFGVDGSLLSPAHF